MAVAGIPVDLLDADTAELTGIRSAFEYFHFAVESLVTVGTVARVTVDFVDALALILAGFNVTLVDVLSTQNSFVPGSAYAAEGGPQVEAGGPVGARVAGALVDIDVAQLARVPLDAVAFEPAHKVAACCPVGARAGGAFVNFCGAVAPGIAQRAAAFKSTGTVEADGRVCAWI